MAETTEALSAEQLAEAILFIGSVPLSLAEFRRAAPQADAAAFAAALASLNARYERTARPYRAVAEGEGWRLRLRPELAEWLAERLRPDRGVKLTPAQLEVLAAVAYRQPISRPALEQLIHRDVAPALRRLLRLGLAELEVAGEKDAAATQYRTTARFLEVFGLPELADLPRPEEP